MQDWGTTIVGAAIAVVLAIVGWFIRVVFTNQKLIEETRRQLALLELKQDLNHKELVKELRVMNSLVLRGLQDYERNQEDKDI